MTHVLVAHAPEEKVRAALVAEKLDTLGYRVRQDGDVYRPLSPFERRRLKAEIDQAACVLVLWSREAAEAPALRAAAERAAASGKLALVRLDAAAPPMGFSAAANLSNWMGRETLAWRKLLNSIGAAARTPAPRAAAKAAESRPAATSAKNKDGGGGLLLGAFVSLLAAVALGYYFFVM